MSTMVKIKKLASPRLLPSRLFLVRVDGTHISLGPLASS